MEWAVEKIYKDVLAEKNKIVLTGSMNGCYYVATYFPHNPAVEIVNYGYNVDIMLQHTRAEYYKLKTAKGIKE